MVASRETMTGHPGTEVLELSARMEAYASEGEWQEVEILAAKLRAAVLDIPEADRQPALMVLAQSTDKIRAMAEHARREVTERLSALRRGRDAARAYGIAVGTTPGDQRERAVTP